MTTMKRRSSFEKWLLRKLKTLLWRILMTEDKDQSLVKSDRSDQLHDQQDVDSLSRMMLQQKESFDRNLLEERLFSNKLKGWLERYSRMNADHRRMEDQLMQEAAVLLGNPPRDADPDAPEAEIVDEPPEEAA
jgi:hypothetical protein